MREPRRERRKREVRDENMEEKEKEKEDVKKENRGFFGRFNGKHVELKLTTGDVLGGVLETTGYNKFDTLLSNSEGCYLVPKHAIVFIKIHEKDGGSDVE